MISLKPNEVLNPRIENLLATQAFDSITESLSSDGVRFFCHVIYTVTSLYG